VKQKDERIALLKRQLADLNKEKDKEIADLTKQKEALLKSGVKLPEEKVVVPASPVVAAKPAPAKQVPVTPVRKAPATPARKTISAVKPSPASRPLTATAKPKAEEKKSLTAAKPSLASSIKSSLRTSITAKAAIPTRPATAKKATTSTLAPRAKVAPSVSPSKATLKTVTSRLSTATKKPSLNSSPVRAPRATKPAQEETKVEAKSMPIAIHSKAKPMPVVERKAVEGPSHVQFLWGCKQKSRDSFLMVLDFLPLAKSSYKGLLGLLQPAYGSGHSFYEQYIVPKFEIGMHKLYRTSKFLINDSLTLGNPGWFPSKESIKQLV
jgi:hypothetical protein